MIDRIIAFALHQRFITLALALLLTASGIVSYSRLPIEAYPDVGDVKVEVITLWPGHSAEEVERLITIPIENELNGIANVTFLRSDTLFGLSNIRVLFADGIDDYWARQQVQERLAQAELRGDAKPQLGPLSSVIGEIYRYTLESKTMSLIELKALQDWVLEREYKKVPGVADVVSWGGGTKQYQITVDPSRLRAYNLTLRQVFDAVAGNNSNAGGGYIAQGDYRVTVRGIGLIQTPADIESIVISAQKGTPVRVRDVGTVDIGHAIRLGVLGRDHEDDLVQGIVLMRKGENPGKVIDGVKQKTAEIQKMLPPGVEMRPYYSRDRLVNTTVKTVLGNLVEGAGLVVFLLTLFLYNLRAALIVALTIPLSLLFAFIFMDLRGIPANLLSLGAIDFGIIVDGAVIMTENIVRHLSERKPSGPAVLREVEQAAREVAKPLTFAVLIIMTVYVPILTFQRIEGKLFRPMAVTISLAVIGALLLTLDAHPGALQSCVCAASLGAGEPPRTVAPAPLLDGPARRSEAARRTRGRSRRRSAHRAVRIHAAGQGIPPGAGRGGSLGVDAVSGRHLDRSGAAIRPGDQRAAPQISRGASRRVSARGARRRHGSGGARQRRILRGPEAPGRVDDHPKQGEARRDDERILARHAWIHHELLPTHQRQCGRGTGGNEG